MKKGKSTVATGEELLGVGSFGCVFKPAFACSKDVVKVSAAKQKKGAKQVSKVFINNSSIKMENAFALRVAEWDPKGRYFVVPTTVCKTETELVRKHAKAYECDELFFVKDKHVSQIVMPNNGVDMYNYFKNASTPNMPLAKWVHLMGDLFAGLKILDTHGYTHLDIKSLNVLFDGTQLRLFDFSLSIPSSTVYDKTQCKRLISTYYPYPFEFILVYYKKYNPNSTASLMRQFEENLMSFGSAAFNNFLLYHSTEKLAAKRESIRKWVETDKKWFDKTLTSQTDKIDLYGIGMLCIDIHRSLDFTTTPTNVQTAYIAFVTAITEMDTRDRLSLKDAIIAYKKLKKLSATTFSSSQRNGVVVVAPGPSLPLF